jgi:hypothetical protein
MIACGFGYFLLVNQALVDLIGQVSGGSDAYLVASMAFLVVLALPGVALMLTGGWNLARHFRLAPAGSQ